MDNPLFAENTELYSRDPYPNYNHVVLSDIGSDYSVTYVDTKTESMNVYGLVHGGLYFTLADTSVAFAARTDGHSYVTTQASVQFLKSAKSGRITATSTVIHRTRSTCLIRTEVRDCSDELLFFGTFNLLRTDR